MGILCVLAGIAGGVAFLLAPALAQYWMIGLILRIGVAFVGAALLIARTMRMRKEEKAIQLAIAKSEEEKRKLKEPVDEIQSLLSQVGTQMEQLRREVSAFLEQYRLYCDVDEARARERVGPNTRRRARRGLYQRAQALDSVEVGHGESRERL